MLIEWQDYDSYFICGFFTIWIEFRFDHIKRKNPNRIVKITDYTNVYKVRIGDLTVRKY